MKRKIKTLVPVVILAVVPFLGGCVAAWVAGSAAAVGVVSAVTYSRGTCRATLNAPIFESDLAVKRVCGRINLVVRKRRLDNDAYRSEYLFEDINGTDVRIGLKRRDASTTKIWIHIGTFGDKQTSMEILAAVEEELQNILPTMGL